MNRITTFFNQEKVNAGRQINIDVMKFFATISMIICHIVLKLSVLLPNYAEDWRYLFADEILGVYIFVAHGFMLAMGIGVIYSRKTDPKSIFLRGLKLYAFGITLNLFRASVFIPFVPDLEDRVGYFFLYLFESDIMQFAGLALMFTALLKKLKLNNFIILGIAIGLSIIGTFIGTTVKVELESIPLSIFVGNFVYSGEIVSYFTLFNWYIMVAVGLVFGDLLIRAKNQDKLYKITLLISAPITIVYIILSAIYGCCFLCVEYNFCALGTLEAIGLLSIDFTFLSIFYFIFKNIKQENNLFTIISTNLNAIYCIHWLIVGFLEFLLIYYLKVEVPYWVSYTISVPIILVSFLLADVYKLVKNKIILSRQKNLALEK